MIFLKRIHIIYGLLCFVATIASASAGGRVVEQDEDGDGRIDQIAHLNDSGDLVLLEIDTDQDGRMDTRQQYQKGEVVRIERDTDGDGAFDILIRWKKGHPVSREEDTDRDGQMDRFTEFDDRGQPVLMREFAEPGQAPTRISRFQNGTLVSVEEISPDRSVLTRFRDDQPVLQEVDEDRDGRPEQTTVFDQGVIQKEVFDTHRDGKPDTRRYYEKGVLVRIEQDRNHDGTADAERIYRDGTLVRSNLDEDGDGYFETTVREGHPEAGRVMEITDAQGRLIERREYTDEVLRKKEVFDAGAGLPVLVEEYGPDGRILLSREAENGSKILNLTWRYDADESAVLAEKDTDGDGRIDLWHHYEDGRIIRVEEDRNRDGRPDLWEFYDSDQAVVRCDEDLDFDGTADIQKRF